MTLLTNEVRTNITTNEELEEESREWKIALQPREIQYIREYAP